MTHTEGETSKQQPLYNGGFNTFCEQFYMTKVKEQFVKIVAHVESADASNKTSRLKQRMKGFLS